MLNVANCAGFESRGNFETWILKKGTENKPHVVIRKRFSIIKVDLQELTCDWNFS